MRTTSKRKTLPTITRYLRDVHKPLFTLIEGRNKYISESFQVETKVKQHLQCQYVMVERTGGIITGLQPTATPNTFRGNVLRKTKTGTWKNSFLIAILSKSGSKTFITILFYLNKKPRSIQKFLRSELNLYFQNLKEIKE